MFFENLLTFENLAAFLALAALEIVLGIDNLVYITIVTSRLPKEQQPLARKLGLAFALLTRLALLFVLSWLVNLQWPVFNLADIGIPQSLIEQFAGHPPGDPEFDAVNGVSWRDIVLFGGGLFLVFQSVREIHEQLGHDHTAEIKPPRMGFAGVIVQIGLMDIIFSLDSVITAVGMAKDLTVMVAAIVVSMIVMVVSAEKVSKFVEDNPTLKMLALSFLILIGVLLIAEGSGAHLDKGYVYFAMAFALAVEGLNIRLRKKHGI